MSESRDWAWSGIRSTPCPLTFTAEHRLVRHYKSIRVSCLKLQNEQDFGGRYEVNVIQATATSILRKEHTLMSTRGFLIWLLLVSPCLAQTSSQMSFLASAPTIDCAKVKPANTEVLSP